MTNCIADDFNTVEPIENNSSNIISNSEAHYYIKRTGDNKAFTKEALTDAGQYVGKFDAVIGGKAVTVASGQYLREMTHMDAAPFNLYLRRAEIEPVMKLSQNCWVYDYKDVLSRMMTDGII